MNPVSEKALRAVCERGDVSGFDRHPRNGRELAIEGTPHRTLVVYIGDKVSDEYRERITSVILSAESSWYLVPRHCRLDQLGLLEGDISGAAIHISEPELPSLSRYLNERPDEAFAPTSDLYAMSGSGAVLLTWDHHSRDDGLTIATKKVAVATTLLGRLNDLGAEMEVFFANPRE